MELRPLPLDQFSESLRRHVDPHSPPPLRMMGARGMVPSAPHETGALLLNLSFDPDESIRSAAKKQAAELPDDLLRAVLTSAAPPTAIYFMQAQRRLSPALVEAMLLNPATPDEVFVEAAKTCSESLTELIAGNQVRLLRTPSIIESLYLNENARMSTLDRLIDLARRNKVRFEGLDVLQSLVEDESYDTAAAAEASAKKVDLFKAVLTDSKLEDAEREIEEQGLTEQEIIERRQKEAESDVPPEKKTTQNKAAAISQMSIAEKMRLATLGSHADRELLIKEANRLVHMAAVRSPKVQLRDIVVWSSNKALPDNVVTYIANHARYRRMYSILVNLANNPKTQLKDCVRMMQQLHDKDLQLLTRNRNVSGTVRRQATALREQRQKKK